MIVLSSLPIDYVTPCFTLTPERMNTPVQFAEVDSPTTGAANGSGVQIRIGAAEIHVDSHADLALLRDVLRIVAQTC